MPTLPVQLKRNGTPGASGPSSLLEGELAINYADGKIYWKNASNVITSFTFQSYALASHTHAASDITSGTLDIARIPTGSTSSAVCIGNDARLSDTRTPTDGSVTTAKIANDAVTYAKIQNVSSTDRILGRSSAGAGDVEEITCTSFGRSLIDDADAAAARTTLSVQPTASPAFTGAATFDNTGNVVPVTITNAGTANSFVVNDASGDTSPFVIDASGNVGIGVTPTSLPLTVFSFATSDADKATMLLNGTVSSGQSFAGIRFTHNVFSTGWAADIRCVDTGNFGGILSFRTSATGSATATPTERLKIDASGTATFAGQILADDLTTSNSVVYGFDGDTNTGVGRGGADILTFVTNGTERVRVDASGNVGIGNTPTTLLEVGAIGKTPVATANAAFFWGASLATASTGNANVQILSTDAQAADLGGSIGLGGSYNTTQSLSFAVIAGRKTNSTNNNAGGYLQFFTRNQGGGVLGEAARITDDGYLLVGYTASNGAYRLQVNSQIYATNATVATSDSRFKTNVESLADATSVIEALRPVAFDFIPQSDRNFAAERQVGLIAQEAQAALAGTDYADSVVAQCGDHLGLAYEKLVPVLIKALQESNARIAALEERLNHA